MRAAWLAARVVSLFLQYFLAFFRSASLVVFYRVLAESLTADTRSIHHLFVHLRTLYRVGFLIPESCLSFIEFVS
jgi:hypothetical protein